MAAVEVVVVLLRTLLVVVVSLLPRRLEEDRLGLRFLVRLRRRRMVSLESAGVAMLLNLSYRIAEPVWSL